MESTALPMYAPHRLFASFRGRRSPQSCKPVPGLIDWGARPQRRKNGAFPFFIAVQSSRATIMPTSVVPASATGSTSASLIKRAIARNADAWRRMSALYGPMVYRWARQSGLQSQDAADVVQEVFRSVATHLAGFHRDHPGDSFR